MRLYFVLWESYWQGKGVYPGPCFFVAVLFLRFAGCRQMVCRSVHRQPRLAAGRRDQASHHQLASPIGPPPFKGRTKGHSAPSQRIGTSPTVRPSKGGGPCGAWWWDAWALGNTTIPGLKQLRAPCPPFKGRGTMRSMVVGCLSDGGSFDAWLETTS